MPTGLPARESRRSLGWRLRVAVPRALGRLTWATLGVTLAIVIVFEGWVLVEMADLYPSMNARQSYLSGTLVTFAMAFSISYAR